MTSINREEMRTAANAVRVLSMDAVQKATCGHPGMPMGMADVAVDLWSRWLSFNPKDPAWPNRDRFVLSAGHGSMLLYSLLHLSGYALTMDDLRQFRQWGSRTPGHPEHGLTPGVETTTGPLGQGVGNAVGMAIAEQLLAERFNRPGYTVVDHRTFAIASDGDLMEGVSHEACSLAGHLKLGKLIVLYDDNGISIDGPTTLSFTEDVPARFAAYGWHTTRVDGHDVQAVDDAIAAAVADPRPSLVACRTKIGFGCAEREGTSKAHGEALGVENVKKTKIVFGYDPEQSFTVPENAGQPLREAAQRGAARQAAWQDLMKRYAQAHPDLATAFAEALEGRLPAGWDTALPTFPLEKPIATRTASGAVINAIISKVPTLVGGSADLTPSNNTQPPAPAGDSVEAGSFAGRYMRYGVREHGMGSVMNGMVLHGGVRPYAGTFFVFSDYMRPAVRLAALMELPVIFVFTHDSIGLGEDGPTHQPIEHLASLRAMPNLVVVRPADATETVEAWRVALTHVHGPTALVLTRQGLPVLDRAVYAPAAGVAKGGYTLLDHESPEVILIASGSEVSIALAAARTLSERGTGVRVVSMPSTELFDAQPAAYRERVLPSTMRSRVAIEAGATHGLERYVGLDGTVIGLDRFGASAPYETLYRELGLTAEAVVSAAEQVVSRASFAS